MRGTVASGGRETAAGWNGGAGNHNLRRAARPTTVPRADHHTIRVPMPTARSQPAADASVAVERETVEHLQRLIRIPSVNPPGEELAVATYLDGVLSSAGIATQLFEPAPGRGAVVARIRGDGSRRPVLLLAHMDVVGVDREQWSADPFGGEVRDGYLYGRGAIDDKGMLAANLMVMLQLQRQVIASGERLRRDVVFVATPDEETGGELGMGWLIEHQRALLDAEFAINEGGRLRIVDGKALYLAVQTAEKVPHTVTLTARGPGGHASVPLADNAVSRLGRALAAVHAVGNPIRLLPTTREFFRKLAAVWPDPAIRRAMADVVSANPRRVRRGARALGALPALRAVLSTGISATVVRGGTKGNVIPAEATATLNVRTLPGESIDAVVARMRRAIGDDRVEVAIVHRGADAPASDHQSAMFAALADAARALEPSLTVVPYLSTGATDSARLRRIGIQTLGILPFPMDQHDEARMHGADERIPLASLAFGTRLLYDAVLRVAR